jgi:hypothetical protein
MTSEPCPVCKSGRVWVKYQLTRYRIAECMACKLESHDNFRGGGDTDEMFCRGSLSKPSTRSLPRSAH